MGMIPAHMMRSVGGGFDNESVVMSTMCLTFYFHVRSLRNQKSWFFGLLAGIAYIATTATWGGHIFALNLIGAHVMGLVLLGRYSSSLHKAYSLFFIVGTAGAIRVPVVGMSPLTSLEQLGPFFVFVVLQLVELSLQIKTRLKLTKAQVKTVGFGVFTVVALITAVVSSYLWSSGYFRPFSSRVRGIFIPHKSTGNPLVDSVSEHQPASAGMYFQFLHNTWYVVPFGFLFSLYHRNDGKYFLLAYSMVVYYVATKMVRLMILTSPITSVLAGLVIGLGLDWAIRQLSPAMTFYGNSERFYYDELPPLGKRFLGEKLPQVLSKNASAFGKTPQAQLLAKAGAVLFIAILFSATPGFISHSKAMADSFCATGPVIVRQATLRTGEHIILDDYKVAYEWLRDNTPEDARVMSWWDYGYQITGIGNRTTLADGNTWNHEHIALLGLCLASPEKEAHRIIRHLADYVLVWGGGQSDDVAKSPHIARIGNSVYNHLCPNDPMCSSFGFYQDAQGRPHPTPMMENSLLFKLAGSGRHFSAAPDRNLFQEVYSSKYGLIKIFKVMSVSKKSKEWVADPANRVCDAPGSWYCTGQYPPAIDFVFENKRDFSQLEDFNKKDLSEEAQKYQQDYLESMANAGRGAHHVPRPGESEEGKALPKLSFDWKDTPYTSAMWQLIHDNNLKGLAQVLDKSPDFAKIRSSDGRGPLFWAYEYKRTSMITKLITAGADPNAKDSSGLTPKQMKMNNIIVNNKA